MKLYAPKYYKNFKCAADKCEHSCCVGWEIDIDDESLSKYKAQKSGYGDKIKKSVSTHGTPHFKLDRHERCPHLDKRGLCKIITELGEDFLCDICREHPRFYNYTDVAEVGIGASCIEAAEIILSSPDYSTLEEIGSLDAEAYELDFDAKCEREKIYGILNDSAFSYEKRLESIYKAYSIEKKNDGFWLEILASLEYLDDKHSTLFLNYSEARRQKGFEEYSERFLAYLIYRHVAEASDAEDFRLRLAFCLFCEHLFSSLIYNEAPKSLIDAARLAVIISEEIEYSSDNTYALTYHENGF